VDTILIFIPLKRTKSSQGNIKMNKATLMKMQLLKASCKLSYPKFEDNLRRVI